MITTTIHTKQGRHPIKKYFVILVLSLFFSIFVCGNLYQLRTEHFFRAIIYVLQ